MNRKLALIIGIQAFLIVLLFWVLVFYGKDEYEASTHTSEDNIQAPNRVSLMTIQISPATQTQSDISTSLLKPITHQSGVSSYGNVISIDSLIELRSRYLATKAESQVISTSLAHNKIELARLRELNFDDKNISDKALAAAQADTKTDEAKMLAAESNAKNIADSMRQTWGDALTKLATEKNPSVLLQSLIDYREVLVQITLPFDSAEPTANSNVSIAPTIAPSKLAKAIYLSQSPSSAATIQGKTYFYHANSHVLRAGMQIKVSNLNNASKLTGVLIPASAVVWYAGKPWAYKKTNENQFDRLPINTNVEVENGWFYQNNQKIDQIGDLKNGLKVGLSAGDKIVTSGAQLLLSEEFKAQITNENED